MHSMRLTIENICSDSHHGAKNSTNISGSASTLEAKLDALRSRTSDAPSALAKEAKMMADAAGMKDRRILV